MDDLMGVHVVACTDELNHEEAGFGFSEPSAVAKHVHEGARLAKFERHVYVEVVLEAVAEVHDVGVRKRAMYLNFCVKLGSEGVI
jgi:hypothetical protein